MPLLSSFFVCNFVDFFQGAWEKAAAEKHTILFEISEPVKKTAKLGGWEGKIKMSEDFNEPLEEFKENM